MFNWFKKEETNMLDALKALWHPEESLTRLSSVLSLVVQLVEHFDENNLKDGNTRNAAIDTVVQLLQSEKTS